MGRRVGFWKTNDKMSSIGGEHGWAAVGFLDLGDGIEVRRERLGRCDNSGRVVFQTRRDEIDSWHGAARVDWDVQASEHFGTEFSAGVAAGEGDGRALVVGQDEHHHLGTFACGCPAH